MDKVKIGIINICSQQRSKIEETYSLFSSKSSKDVYFHVSSYDNFVLKDHSHLKQICAMSILHDSANISNLDFEQMYEKEGIIKSSLNKTFVIHIKSHSFVCLLNIGACEWNKYIAKRRISMDGYALSLFLYCLSQSNKYVDIVSNYISCQFSVLCQLPKKDFNIELSELKIKLKEPEKHVMDLTWAKMACAKMEELRQLQYTMSWLSTLGGAFSALGEEQERCAKAAGMISIEQLRLAMKLGDEIIVAQCKLYFSLSLIQRGRCHLAKRIILEQFNKTKKGPVVDKKTLNMCKGIWARLKYEYYLKRLAKEKRN